MALINYITQVQFGLGKIKTLQEECTKLGIKNPPIVTDAGIRNAGLLDSVQQQLTTPAAVFDQTPPNPNEAAVRAAVTHYQEHACDGIIALGGGSAIDLAKGVAVCAAHPGPLRQFAVRAQGIANSHLDDPSIARLVQQP